MMEGRFESVQQALFIGGVRGADTDAADADLASLYEAVSEEALHCVIAAWVRDHEPGAESLDLARHLHAVLTAPRQTEEPREAFGQEPPNAPDGEESS